MEEAGNLKMNLMEIMLKQITLNIGIDLMTRLKSRRNKIDGEDFNIT